jgi:hypothetical protein
MDRVSAAQQEDAAAILCPSSVRRYRRRQGHSPFAPPFERMSPMFILTLHYELIATLAQLETKARRQAEDIWSN